MASANAVAAQVLDAAAPATSSAPTTTSSTPAQATTAAARIFSQSSGIRGCAHLAALSQHDADSLLASYRSVVGYALRFRNRHRAREYNSRRSTMKRRRAATTASVASSAAAAADGAATPVPTTPSKLGWASLPIPACHDCTTCTDQLHACLSCVYIGCFAGSHRHAQAHAHSNATHMFSVEFLHGQLYCAACQDFVYDLEFEDALGTQKRVVGELLSQVNDPHNKRQRYSEWSPSPDEKTLLESGAQLQGHLGLRGMRNLGSTCFMNVILQCFIHNPPLRSYFLSDKHNARACPNDRATCLACQTDNLFSQFYSGEITPFAPYEFLWAMWMSCSQLIGYAQQDAHEFFIGAVNGMHNSLEAADPSLTDHDPSKCGCIVHRIFCGTFQSTVTCQQCGNESHANDPFLDISLDIRPVNTPPVLQQSHVPHASSTLLGAAQSLTTPTPGRPKGKPTTVPNGGTLAVPASHQSNFHELQHIYSCLDRFTHQERLGPHEYRCSKCQSSATSGTTTAATTNAQSHPGAVKQLSLKKLPLVLALQLKRFDHHHLLASGAYFQAGQPQQVSSPAVGAAASVAGAATGSMSTMSGSAGGGGSGTSGDDGGRGKLNHSITVPIDLDMTAYTTAGVSRRNNAERVASAATGTAASSSGNGKSAVRRSASGGSSIKGDGATASVPLTHAGTRNSAPASALDSASYMYTLFAVIVHHGTLHSGHYTCYVRQSGGTGQWFRFNDHMVVAVDYEEVAKCQAYMCFYMKKNMEYQ